MRKPISTGVQISVQQVHAKAHYNLTFLDMHELDVCWQGLMHEFTRVGAAVLVSGYHTGNKSQHEHGLSSWFILQTKPLRPLSAAAALGHGRGAALHHVVQVVADRGRARHARRRPRHHGRRRLRVVAGKSEP